MHIHVLVFGALLTALLVAGMRRLPRRQRMRTAVGGLLACNGLVVAAAVALLLVGVPSVAQEAGQAAGEADAAAGGAAGGVSGWAAIGAGLAVGLAAIGAGIAVGIAGSAAIGAITEKPEVLGRTLIFVGLAEGIAIYGLIVAFMLLTGFGG